MRALSLTIVFASALAAACAAPIKSAGNGTSAVYVLEAVDGRALPPLDGEGSSIARRELSEGMLQLRTDGTFYLDLGWLVNTGAGTRHTSQVYQGSWMRHAESIRLDFADGQVSTSQLIGGAMEIEIGGRLYRFVR